MFGVGDPSREQPVLGMYMRHRREALGLTQDEVARRMFISLSLYRKLENGERALSAERLGDWCAAMDAPLWLLEKMISLAMRNASNFAVGSWPPALRQEDLDHLDALPYPAYFHAFPEMEVIAANHVARAAFPWLVPASPDAERPVNLVEQFMTVPAAREIIVNWETIVQRLLYTLRIMGPGNIAPERLAQIVDTCRANPEFDRLWNSTISEELFNDSLVLARHPETGERMTFTMRTYNPFHPQDCAYQLFLLTPRAPGTPSVDPFAAA